MGIKDAGFKKEFAGSHRGTMWGNGIYFAEASSKADEYAHPEEAGIYQGCCAMLLCRVALGRTATLLEPDGDAVEAALAGGADAIIGDREKAVGTYREFVVFDNASCYPEYVVIYRRQYSSDSSKAI